MAMLVEKAGNDVKKDRASTDENEFLVMNDSEHHERDSLGEQPAENDEYIEREILHSASEVFE